MNCCEAGNCCGCVDATTSLVAAVLSIAVLALVAYVGFTRGGGK